MTKLTSRGLSRLITNLEHAKTRHDTNLEDVQAMCFDGSVGLVDYEYERGVRDGLLLAFALVHEARTWDVARKLEVRINGGVELEQPVLGTDIDVP